METKRITILTGAFSAILVLSFFNFITQPANALDQFTVTYPSNCTSTGGTNLIRALPLQTGNEVVSVCDYKVNVYRQSDFTSLKSFNFLSGLKTGGSSGPFAGYSLQSLNCDVANTGLCAVYIHGNSSLASRIIMIDAINGVASPLSSGANDTAGNNGAVYVNGGSSTGGTGQTVGTLYSAIQDTLGTNHEFVRQYSYNVTGAVTDPHNRLVLLASHDIILTGNTPTSAIWGYVTTGANQGAYLGIMNVAGFMSIYSFNTQSVSCNTGTTGANGDVDFVNDASGVYWLITRQNTLIYKIDFTCAVSASIDLTTVTGGNKLASIQHSNSRHEIYVDVVTKNQLLVINETSFSASPSAIYNIGAPSTFGNGMAVADDLIGQTTTNGFVSSAVSSTSISVIYWAQRGSGGTPPTTNTVCIDTTPNGPSATLNCFTCPPPAGANYACPHGFPSGTGIPPFNLFYNGSQSTAIVACATGWFSCSNQNILTNGAGFALLIIVLLFTVIIILWATYKTGHEVREVTFPIMLICTLECGAFWQMNLSTSVPFFVAILGVIGLGAFKIYSHVTGRE